MDCPRKFHYIPGRLRIDIPGLPGNRALAKKIAHYLTRIPGIHSGSANPVSGRLPVFLTPINNIEPIIGTRPAQHCIF